MKTAIALCLFLFSISASASFISTGGGGGSGDVVGPSSSILNSVPVFCDTTGLLLCDAQTGKTMRIPIGDLVDGAGVMGVQWYGTGTSGAVPTTPTGMKLLYQSGNLYEQHVLDSKQLMVLSATVGGAASTTDIAIQAAALRPDNLTGTLGTTVHRWSLLYANKMSVPQSIGRAIVIGNLNDANITGIGIDAQNLGREVYFQTDIGPSYLDYFNVKTLTPFTTTTISAPDETTANSAQALTIHAKGANKTAGTGDGGDFLISGGTSAGGNAGHAYMPTCTASPPTETPVTHSGFVAFCYDTSGNKECYYDGGWSCP